MVKILLFAGLSEKIGVQELMIEAAGREVEALLQSMKEKYPQAAGELGQAMVAINEEFVDPDTVIQPNDVIAFIPPVSGG